MSDADANERTERPPRIFLLSPARLDGARARAMFAPPSASGAFVRSSLRSGLGPKTPGAIASALRTREGAPIGDVFQLLSGLYFRGKLAYGRRFARPPEEASWVGSGALVITANRGLVPAECRVTIDHLEAFAQTDIRHDERQFVAPLVRDATLLRDVLGDAGEIVLLGSVAQAKYTSPLLEVFGDRLLFPHDFVGRGDMSRGGLLLRAVESGVELGYAAVRGASLRGARPPKLERRR